MKRAITRRSFLKTGTVFGLMLTTRRPAVSATASFPADQVRLAIVGLGGINVPGSVGGRGRQLIALLREIPAAKITTLCDVDRTILDAEARLLEKDGVRVTTHVDFRRVLDDKTIDAVVLATPNHWHGLGTVWACQAGKDVYVEKPFSHNIWEGRQMVAAARKYGRMVQIGTQRRSSRILMQAFDYLRSGQLGKIRSAHALVFRPREGIGKVNAPTPPPASVDYDLWCGPAPKMPIMRKQLHYDWHWVWLTGNGEVGNNGTHVIDICRWALGQNQPPPRAISIGERYAFNDDGETPNTHIAFFDYQPAPLICEIRNVSKGKSTLGNYRKQTRGIVIECEGGYFAGDFTGGAVFDNQDRKIKDFQDGLKARDIEKAHLANFLAAIRSRKADDLNAEAAVGHVSTVCSLMANVSHRIGKKTSPDAIREVIKEKPELEDAFERCSTYLQENGIDMTAEPAVLGPWVNYDAAKERFTGDFAELAEELSRREYRPPFVVPKLV